MYLINKDETEHTGQVTYNDPSLRSLQSIKSDESIIILSELG